MTLSTNQRRALRALLTQPTIAKAATQAGLSIRTVFRYLSNDEFLAALRSEQDKLLAAATAHLAELSGTALEHLSSVLTALASQVGSSMEHFVTIGDDGQWVINLTEAEKAGLLHLVRKVKDDELELYSAQAAADKLGRLCLALLTERRRAAELDDLAVRVTDLEGKLRNRIGE